MGSWRIHIALYAALLVGAVLLIQWRDPEHFWQDAWLPALAIAAVAFRRWSAHRTRR